MPYHDFADMPVWKKAREIVEEVYKLTEQLPKKEDYVVSSQLRNAAISITGNIAEGFGRGHAKDKIHFYYFSRASCYELRSHLYAAETVGYFKTGQIKSIEEKCILVVEELNKMIKGLRNHKV